MSVFDRLLCCVSVRWIATKMSFSPPEDNYEPAKVSASDIQDIRTRLFANWTDDDGVDAEGGGADENQNVGGGNVMPQGNAGEHMHKAGTKRAQSGHKAGTRRAQGGQSAILFFLERGHTCLSIPSTTPTNQPNPIATGPKTRAQRNGNGGRQRKTRANRAGAGVGAGAKRAKHTKGKQQHEEQEAKAELEMEEEKEQQQEREQEQEREIEARGKRAGPKPSRLSTKIQSEGRDNFMKVFLRVRPFTEDEIANREAQGVRAETERERQRERGRESVCV